MSPTQKSKSSPRFVAIETLCRLQKSRKPVNALFNSVLSDYPLESNDRQLAVSILYGLLRNRQSLDLMLQHLCTKPLKKLKPFIHQALRVGLFQILYLDRIPESAAVNESVKAVQAARLPKQLQGFVNGVLRNSIRKRDELLKIINNPAQPVLNHPDWMCRRWETHYGREETLRICTQNNEQAALTLQVNSSKIDRKTLLAQLQQTGVTAHIGEFCEDTLVLENFHGAVTGLTGFAEGLFQVQDQGAQLLPQLLGPMVEKGDYLDGCAGVGGKTSVLVQLAAPVQAKISAVEPDRVRQEKFKENMQRLHPETDIPLFKTSLQEFAASTSKRFHGVLLDAPCSGTGVIRRHPDIRWNRRVEDFSHYQDTQLELLQSAATLLLPRGILVYGTCSLEKEENEEVIDCFLAANSNFSLRNCGSFLSPAAQKLVKGNYFAPLPNAEIDGFFGAILIKQTDAS